MPVAKIAIAALTIALLGTPIAQADTCVTRQSGSVTETSCSGTLVTCRSYWSGSVKKTTCS